jgi:hypothetical protein
MSYTTTDFAESLSRVRIDPADVVSVLTAWGSGSGMGKDAGHYRYAPYGASEWSGGFLFRLKDGCVAYLTGWCDYSGWGCQDGAEVHYFNERPSYDVLKGVHTEWSAPPPESEWDEAPADLNRWLAKGAPDAYDFDGDRA